MKKNQRGFMRSIGDGMAQAFFAAMAFMLVIGILLGIFFSLGVPAIWEWFKPILHSWTA